MRPVHFAQLVLLAAIWGGSFLLMRVLVPALGPLATADLRILIGGAALVGLAALRGRAIGWRQRWRLYLVIGLVNSGTPFLLYSWAAQHLPASYSAVLNSTAPLSGMVFAYLVLGQAPGSGQVLGGFLGLAGVAVLTRLGPVAAGPEQLLAVLACMAAAACYALAGVGIKRWARDIPPDILAGTSQLAAGLAMLPGVLALPPPGPLTGPVLAGVLTLALVCSALAYRLYFGLIQSCGPTQALTVTFLIPPFGLVWGHLVLGEALSPGMLLGCALVVLGTGLVVRATSVTPPGSPPGAPAPSPSDPD